MRGVRPLVPHVRLPVLLAGPAPSGSADASRRCQGCFHPHPRPGGSGCPQLRRTAATARQWWSLTPTQFNSASWRSKSATQSRSGASGEKFRSARSSCIRGPTQNLVLLRKRGHPHCSSSRLRRRSPFNSCDSALTTPGRVPSSISAWSNQLRSQDSQTPKSIASWPIEASPRQVTATTSSRNSFTCAADMPTPPSGDLTPPQARYQPNLQQSPSASVWRSMTLSAALS